MRLLAFLNRLFAALRARFRGGANSTQPSLWGLDANSPYSQSANPTAPAATAQHQQAEQRPTDKVFSQEEFEKEQAQNLKRPINTWIRLVRENVESHLQQHVNAASPGNPDDIFSAHTAFVKFCVDSGVSKLPILCWEQKLVPLVEAAEKELQKRNAAARIHKGAPFFNVGVCHFANGDLENGFKYLGSAGKEDELSGRGSPFSVLIGDHPLSKQFLIRPVARDLVPAWTMDYQRITQLALDENELTAVIKQTALRPTDGIQLVAALHHYIKALRPPQNDWTCFLRTRALADALVALESMLRRVHHTKGIESELHNQLTALLQANKNSAKEFDAFHQWFLANWKAKKLEKSAAAVNACVAEAFLRMAAATTSSARAGIACYVAVRLRNSLLHVLEDALDIYRDEGKCLSMFGYIIAVFRIVKHGEDGTLVAIP